MTAVSGRGAPSARDRAVVTFQLGRPPRGEWHVVSRCRWGFSTAIAVAPLVEGEPFPTSLWLTCPHLSSLVDALESAGGAASWTARVAADACLAEAVLAADAAYRRMRSDLGGGEDPCGEVGVAGQADALVVKCLHARVAASLGGLPDPVGEAVLAGLDADGTSRECGNGRCEAALAERDVSGLG